MVCWTHGCVTFPSNRGLGSVERQMWFKGQSDIKSVYFLEQMEVSHLGFPQVNLNPMFCRNACADGQPTMVAAEKDGVRQCTIQH